MKRQLRYADISDKTPFQQGLLLQRMRDGFQEVRTRTVSVRVKVGSRYEYQTKEEKYTFSAPALALVWIAEVQGKTILYGYMHQEECPVPFMDRSLPKQPKQKPIPKNGGLLTEEEYKLCLR